MHEVISHYNRANEENRLKQSIGLLEFERTRELLSRFLPPPPARVLDVGGGAGIYSLWLAASAYETHLIDLVPLHVEQARQASEAQPEHRLCSAEVGDARCLPQSAGSMDVVLLLGPLYHLVERGDRNAALTEAWRVLRPGGWLFATSISRFSSIISGLVFGFLSDPVACEMVEEDLRSGRHSNPTDRLDYFTTAYLHRADELRAEVEQAGFQVQGLFGVEGLGWLLADFDDRWANQERREQILLAARAIETEPSTFGISAHVLAAARK